MKKCPFCDCVCENKDVVDMCHSRKGNEGANIRIYSCPECGSVFRGHKYKNIGITPGIDSSIKTKSDRGAISKEGWYQFFRPYFDGDFDLSEGCAVY